MGNMWPLRGAFGRRDVVTGVADFRPATEVDDPNNVTTQFGGLVAGVANSTFKEEGNLYRKVGNPIAGNAADLTDDIIGGFQIPAGAFDAVGRGVCITAQGVQGSTGNNKRFKVWLNPTMSGQTVAADGSISGGTVTAVGAGLLAYDSGTVTGNAVGWGAIVNFFKIGGLGANTQYSQGQGFSGTSHQGTNAPSFPVFTESAVINIVVTGSSATSGAANDIVLNFLEVNAMN